MPQAPKPTPTMGWATEPHRHSLHVERVIDPHTQQSVVGMVRHPGCAWRATWDGPCIPTPFQVGQAYLQDLDLALSRCRPEDAGDHFIPRGALNALQASAGPNPPPAGLGWLDVTWTQAQADAQDGDNPKGSYWLRRHAGTQLDDASLVLLAGRRMRGWLLGDDIGLRLVVHCTAPGEARVYGVTLAGLSQAMAPLPERLLSDGSALNGLKQRLQAHFGPQDEVWITGVAPVTLGASQTPDNLRVSGHLYRRPSGEAGPVPKALRSLTYRFSVLVNNAQDVVRLLQLRQVRAQGVVSPPATPAPVRAFPIDPASREVGDPGLPPTAAELNRRPGRAADRLNRYQAPLQRVWPVGGRLHHRDPQGRVLFEVQGPRPWPAQAQEKPLATPRHRARSSTSAADPDTPPVVTLPSGAVNATGQPTRNQPGASGTSMPPPAATKSPDIQVDAGDDDAALHAYLRTRELFDRMAAYGLDAHAYFRMAELPLVIRPRAATAWGADGEATTAEVRPFYGKAFGTRGRSLHLGRPQLVVKFGAADAAQRVLRDQPGRLSLRQAGPKPHRYPRAQYLGVAADPRWAWHEFGHVLSHASTGELEFAFAHSAGDALAAIVCDPRARLARTPGQRGITFPWIEVPGRRHDRSPLRGYCWCGRRNRLRLDFHRRQEQFQHGYFEEQLLSSSLFRLYRCLGGDTLGQDGPGDPRPDLDRRLLASDLVVYLVMRAIGVLGPDSLATARTADQFVSALTDADLGTGTWQVTAPWPYENAAPRQLTWVGGRLHKLIRWAFEQQGLYATDRPDEACEGLGQPPAVDLYIGDRRRQTEGQPPDGGYWPVPLRGGTEPAPWWAHPDWVTRQDASLRVRVGNRGLHAAEGLTLRGWCWAEGARAWQPLTAPRIDAPLAPAQTLDVWMAASDGRPLPAGPLWVLAVVDCPADASLLPHQAKPPAAPNDPTALMDWVAHDNNIALLRLEAPG